MLPFKCQGHPSQSVTQYTVCQKHTSGLLAAVNHTGLHAVSFHLPTDCWHQLQILIPTLCFSIKLHETKSSGSYSYKHCFKLNQFIIIYLLQTQSPLHLSVEESEQHWIIELIKFYHAQIYLLQHRCKGNIQILKLLPHFSFHTERTGNVTEEKCISETGQTHHWSRLSLSVIVGVPLG